MGPVSRSLSCADVDWPRLFAKLGQLLEVNYD